MNKTKKIAVNPVIFADFPDPDVIRVENAFYMVSTTMHFMPGAVILRSYNLVDWEIAGHVYDVLDDYPAARMEENSNIYGSGMWAASLKYHDGMFYVLHIANDTHCSYLYKAQKPEGPWTQQKIEGFYYDPGLFFDDDGRVYVVHGNREIRITELDPTTFRGPEKNGLDQVILRDSDSVPLGYEGSHLYKIGGRYVLCLIHWPKDSMRTQACFVADSLEGPWTGGDVLCSDMGDFGQGVAQGGFIDTPDGDWYAMLFQDHGAEGRMPCLVPVVWKDGFPVFGKNGVAPKTFEVTDYNPGYNYSPLMPESFDSAAWEWNHIPDGKLVSFDRTPAEETVLSVTTDRCVTNPVSALNTFTCRLVGPKPSVAVTLDAAALKNGDFMGLIAFAGCYGFIGLAKEREKTYVVCGRTNYPENKVQPNRHDMLPPVIDFRIPLEGPESAGTAAAEDNGCGKETVCRVKLDFDFTDLKDEVKFFWKTEDKSEWNSLGEPLKLHFMLDHFCGVRGGLFVYSTSEPGGTARFSGFAAEWKNRPE